MSASIFECDCGAKVRLPEWEASRSFHCPKCKKGIAITVESLVLKSVAVNAGQETICPICQSEIEVSENCVNCPDCDLVHHQECWSEVGGCGTYGCKQAPVIDKSESTSATPLTAWGDTKKCPACGEEIKAISLRCRYCKTDFGSVDPMTARDLVKQAKVSDELETFKKWVVALFVTSLLGCLAPLISAVSLAYLLPRQAKLNRCGPLFVIMGWTSIGLSILYTVLLLLFFLSQEI
jgi:hypothetical protein